MRIGTLVKSSTLTSTGEIGLVTDISKDYRIVLWVHTLHTTATHINDLEAL